MPVIDLLGPLVSAEISLRGIDDNDEITHILMGCKFWLMLAPKEFSSLDRYPAKTFALGVYDVPCFFHFIWLYKYCIHIFYPVIEIVCFIRRCIFSYYPGNVKSVSLIPCRVMRIFSP